MFARLSRARRVIAAWILAGAVTLLGAATALADGGGTIFPR